jgi:hypothetical protein
MAANTKAMSVPNVTSRTLDASGTGVFTNVALTIWSGPEAGPENESVRVPGRSKKISGIVPLLGSAHGKAADIGSNGMHPLSVPTNAVANVRVGLGVAGSIAERSNNTWASLPQTTKLIMLSIAKVPFWLAG